ncbi:MAG: hypothetical protein ACI3XM_01990 [Eubacteriales bacterium]
MNEENAGLCHGAILPDGCGPDFSYPNPQYTVSVLYMQDTYPAYCAYT